MNQENVLTDEELVGLAVDGDEMAEETLIRRYREFVLDRHMHIGRQISC